MVLHGMLLFFPTFWTFPYSLIPNGLWEVIWIEVALTLEEKLDKRFLWGGRESGGHETGKETDVAKAGPQLFETPWVGVQLDQAPPYT